MSKRHYWLMLFAVVLLLGALTAAVALASSTSQVHTESTLSLAATPAPDAPIIHLVKPGETLAIIARRYGLGVRELATYNRIANVDRIYAGQVLRIPRSGQPTVMPPQPTPSPVAASEEEILIQIPGRGVTITSPVVVSGLASSPFEQTVVVAVLDASGGRIGLASGIISGEYGQRGPFSVTVPFTPPLNSQPGRIQVFTESPRDGTTEHLSSVTVNLKGSDVDALLDQLDGAVSAKDYARLQSLMGPKFALSLYRSEGTELTPEEAIDRLRSDLMGPGAPRLDFSVDARALLGSRVNFGPEVSHLVYSTGWGLSRNDDAVLAISDEDGQARWVGLLYVPHALIDYRVVGRIVTG
jgi:hypothetical protein